MPKNNHLLFVATHNGLNATFHLLGVHHEMQYQELPKNCLGLLDAADLVFHEGRNGLVFNDPFQQPEQYLFNPNNPNHPPWLHNFTAEQQTSVQNLVNHYFKMVKRQFHNMPHIKNIRSWAISELIGHFSYFAKGQEIDHTLHWLRQQKGKKIIDLDEVFLTTRLAESMSRVYDFSQDYIQKELAEIETFFASGKFDFEHQQEELFKDFSFTIEYANDFNRDLPEYISARNTYWYAKFNEYFKKIPPSKHENLVLVCGAAHLPDIMARLISNGFAISIVASPAIIPLSQQTKSMLFSFELEKRAYSSLRAQILGAYEGSANWIREVIVQQPRLNI